jgi:hypothetical protein
MCANKYENRQNDEYECCTPFHPAHMYENKRIHVFCSIHKFLIESFHLLTEKFKKSFEMKISKKKFTLLNILNSPHRNFGQLEFSHQNHSSFLCITHFLTK